MNLKKYKLFLQMRILILEELILVGLKIVEHLDQSLSRILEIYILKQDIRIYMYVAFADQTSGPIGLKFLWTLMGGQGCFRLKKSFFF